MTDLLVPATFIPAGSMMPYLGGATTTPPDGWLFCDGQAVSRTTYGDLFAAIGVTYGSGNGSTTFNLPGGAEVFMKGNGSAVGNTGSSHKHSYTTGFSINLGSGSLHGHSVNAIGTNYDGFPHNHTGAQNISSNSANIFVSNSSAGTNPATAGHTHSFGFTLSGDSAHSHAGNAPSVGGESSHGHGVSVANANLTSDPNVSGPTHLPPHILLWYIIKA